MLQNAQQPAAATQLAAVAMLPDMPDLLLPALLLPLMHKPCYINTHLYNVKGHVVAAAAAAATPATQLVAVAISLPLLCGCPGQKLYRPGPVWAIM
jgi:hypothetical protein